MGTYENNMEALCERYSYVAEKIKTINSEKKNTNIYVKETPNNKKVLHIMRENRDWRLNSDRDPDYAAEVYAERYPVRLYGIYFIFGFSDGRCVRELLRRCDDTNMLIICEPDMELFSAACHYWDIQDLIRDERVVLYFSELEAELAGVLSQLIDYTKIKLIEFCILPGYDVLYSEECNYFMEHVLENMRYEIVNKATHLSFNRSIPQHMLFHMQNLLKYNNLEQLKQALLSMDLEEIPAIIVSAGPSLDKNIHLLKKAQGKAFIMAVDASIRAVIRSGVHPDLLCSVDPNSPERFIDGLDLDDVYWAVNQTSNPVLIEKYAKKILYYGTYGSKWNEALEKELGYALPAMASGGSVSTEAFMIALYLGFRKIIFIGQDLAFTGGKTHTSGIEDALGDKEEYLRTRKIVEVEGIDGDMLETDFQMYFYKQWFEQGIRLNKDVIRVIDATEGGAKIEGTEIRKFDEVIEQECRKTLNIYEIEKELSNPFTSEQQRKLLSSMRTIKKDISEFRYLVERIIAEEKMDREELDEPNLSMEKATVILGKVLRQNKQIDDNPILEYVSMYAQREEYEMGDSVYADEKIEPKQLIEKSIALLEGYQQGSVLFEEDFDTFIIKE